MTFSAIVRDHSAYLVLYHLSCTACQCCTAVPLSLHLYRLCHYRPVFLHSLHQWRPPPLRTQDSAGHCWKRTSVVLACWSHNRKSSMRLAMRLVAGDTSPRPESASCSSRAAHSRPPSLCPSMCLLYIHVTRNTACPGSYSHRTSGTPSGQQAPACASLLRLLLGYDCTSHCDHDRRAAAGCSSRWRTRHRDSEPPRPAWPEMACQAAITLRRRTSTAGTKGDAVCTRGHTILAGVAFPY